MLGGRMGSVSGARIADGDAASQFVDTLSGLSSGVVQIAVSGGVATPSTFVATAKRIPFGSGTNGGLTDSANLVFDTGVTGGAIGVGTSTPVARGEFVTATDTSGGAPVTWDNRFVTIGPNGGANGGAIGMSFQNSTNTAYIIALTPGTGFRTMNLNVDSALAGNCGSVNISGSTGTVRIANRFTCTNDGRFFGLALHNNGGSMTGTTNQYVGSGTYTPTLTGVTNIAASTARKCQWIRVGNVVSVSGSCDIDPTGAGATALGISLPIASNLGLATDLGGDASADSAIAIEAAAVRGDAANDRAEISYTTVNVANHTVYFIFQYEVL